MKRFLLTTGILSLSFGAFAQFTPNRLVVSQYGDGTTALADKTVPVILKEYETTRADVDEPNTPTYTLPLPSADEGGTGSFPITGLPDKASEGLMTLSPNGEYLSVLGYGIPPGQSPASTAMRTIGWVKADGTINTETNVKGGSNNLNSPRCAVTIDGTGFWVVGSGGGIRYKAFGYTSGGDGTVAVATAPGSMRSVAIYNGRIYGTTNASAGPRIGRVEATSTDLPKTNVGTNTALPGFSLAPNSPNQAVFLRIAAGAGDPDLIYIADDDDDNGEIQKWVLDDATSTWVNKGNVKVSSEKTRLSVKGITAHLTAAGTAYVYAVTATELVKITDVNAATSTISIGDNQPEVLAIAPTNTIFRGVAFTPGTTEATLPVKLTSFTGKQQNSAVLLNWTTASEQNNSHFDILRSSGGKAMNVIGRVTGSGNSDISRSYTFRDENPLAGNNYYQLHQVDFNGKSEESPVVVVKTDLKPTAFTVSLTDNNELQLNIYSTVATDTRVLVSDMSGRKLADKQIPVDKGYTQSGIALSGLQSGVYVATLTIHGQIHSVKFAK